MADTLVGDALEVATHPGPGFTYFARWIGRCPAKKGGCGARVVREYASGRAPAGWITYQKDVAPCGSCGRQVGVKMVLGTYRETKRCDARCENATGPDCECPCGGKNHGAGLP